MRRIYLYDFHERMWHWVQALVILLLLGTGLQIHASGDLRLISFESAVKIHTILGIALGVNALLGLLYHVFSGAIRQFLPEPKGFFDLAMRQTSYYLSGIFRGDPHPIVKRRNRKLNPLQQIAYLLLLNVLLPLQLVTGLAMWIAWVWPGITAAAGGLAFLAPLHSFGAWLFGAFVLIHIYLGTTGTTTTSNFKAMVTGWEDMEAPARGRQEK